MVVVQRYKDDVPPLRMMPKSHHPLALCQSSGRLFSCGGITFPDCR